LNQIGILTQHREATSDNCCNIWHYTVSQEEEEEFIFRTKTKHKDE